MRLLYYIVSLLLFSRPSPFRVATYSSIKWRIYSSTARSLAALGVLWETKILRYDRKQTGNDSFCCQRKETLRQRKFWWLWISYTRISMKRQSSKGDLAASSHFPKSLAMHMKAPLYAKASLLWTPWSFSPFTSACLLSVLLLSKVPGRGIGREMDPCRITTCRMMLTWGKRVRYIAETCRREEGRHQGRGLTLE